VVTMREELHETMCESSEHACISSQLGRVRRGVKFVQPRLLGMLNVKQSLSYRFDTLTCTMASTHPPTRPTARTAAKTPVGSSEEASAVSAPQLYRPGNKQVHQEHLSIQQHPHSSTTFELGGEATTKSSKVPPALPKDNWKWSALAKLQRCR